MIWPFKRKRTPQLVHVINAYLDYQKTDMLLARKKKKDMEVLLAEAIGEELLEKGYLVCKYEDTNSNTMFLEMKAFVVHPYDYLEKE